MKILIAFVFILSTFIANAKHHAKNEPLKAFMITGGCCHDYKQQKNIISEGISERVPTKWDIFSKWMRKRVRRS